MSMSFSIKNIRRIAETPDIEIRPITILVGRNSSGKSTFLRCFPLIRQSLETNSSAPILWYGSMVDFGDVKSAIGNHGTKRNASFCFTFNDLKENNSANRLFYSPFLRHYRINSTISVDEVKVEYKFGSRDDETILLSIEVKIPSENIDLRIERSQKRPTGDSKNFVGEIYLNGEIYNFTFRNHDLSLVGHDIFDPLIFVSRQKEEMSRGFSFSGDVVESEIIEQIQQKIGKKLKADTIRWEVRRLLSASVVDESTLRRHTEACRTKTLRDFFASLESLDKLYDKQKIISSFKLFRAFSIFSIIGGRLNSFFNQISYLGPARSTSERFYRRQELEVSEIATNGSNFPIFLASLSKTDLASFSNWVKDIFGYGVDVKRLGGHISIHLDSGKSSINITDTGYGVSQILPVMGLIWWVKSGKTSRRRVYSDENQRTIAIEQPELHLHPAHQAKLADVFSATIAGSGEKSNGVDVRFIIETHSEALINRIGELIEDGVLDRSKVQIVVFSSNDDLDSPSKIQLSEFDENGVLMNWPHGFFNY